MVKKSHQHDVVYYATCPKAGCLEYYTGEIGRKLNERVIDHNERDKKSHLHSNRKKLIIPVLYWVTLRLLIGILKNLKKNSKLMLIRET